MLWIIADALVEEAEMSHLKPASEYGTNYTLLTISRFFAALWVLFLHISVVLQGVSFPGDRLIHNPVSKYGFLGVTFFFVLSGFILGKIYPGKVSPRTFYAKRIIRIYPTYLLILFLMVCIPFFEFPRTLAYCLPVFLLVNAWVPSHAQDLLGPAWSLSCEAFFYALFPFIAIPIVRSSNLTTAALTVLSFLPAAVIQILEAQGMVSTPNIANFPVLHLPSFLLGILFSKFKTAPRKLLVSVFGTIGIFLVLKIVFHPGLPFRAGLCALPFAVIVWALAGERQPTAGWDTKLLVLQGDASYVLYLIHLPILLILKSAGRLNNLADVGTAIAIVIVVATMIYLAIDRPIHQWALHQLKLKSLPRNRETAQA